MLRTSLYRSTRALSSRAFSTARVTMAAGDTGSGSSRSTGAAGGDAFTRREHASEELFIREEEKRKLRALGEKLAKQREHIDALTKEIDEVTKGSEVAKGSGGERK